MEAPAVHHNERERQDSSLPTDLQTQAFVLAYIQSIKHYYRHNPTSAPYYEQLVDYISTHHSSYSSIQATKVLSLESVHVSMQRVEPLIHATLNWGNIQHYKKSSNIVVVEGLPSPNTIVLLGTELSLRPEFFLGHLELSRSHTAPFNYYELPTVPSRRHNAIHIRLVTLGKSRIEPRSIASINAWRTEADSAGRELERDLFRQNRYGATRLRTVNIHDPQFFTVEQMVSFCVKVHSPDAWSAVFLLDRGRDISNTHNLPWRRYMSNNRQPAFLPVIQYNDSNPTTTAKARPQTPTLQPYDPINDCHLESLLELQLLQGEPFFILARLLSTVALSWSQVLNFLEDDVRACQFISPGNSAAALEQLLFNTSFIDRVQSYLLQNLDIVRISGSPSWPQVTEKEAREKMANIHQALVEDYEHLIKHCSRLSARCEQTSASLVSAAQLLEAQKGIAQSGRINRLTQLAFVFVPMGLIASIFGMNVEQLKDSPPIWLFFAVALPVTALTCCAGWYT